MRRPQVMGAPYFFAKAAVSPWSGQDLVSISLDGFCLGRRGDK